MKRDVFKSYDKIADWFAEQRTTLIEKPYLDLLAAHIPFPASILDLGCGTGIPIYAYLRDKGYRLKGVDASTAMLAIAQRNFPDGDFFEQDMRELHLEEQFDAIIAWHSFFHLNMDEQRAMFPRFKEHLKPAGVLLFTSGPEEGEAWGMNHGENLYHASLGEKEYRQRLDEQGFEVLIHRQNDLNCGGATVWLCQYKMP